MEEDSELSSEQIQKEAEAINQKVNHWQAEKKMTAQQAGKGKSQARQLTKDGANWPPISSRKNCSMDVYSKIDPDATFRCMKNGQWLPVYNIIEGSKNQCIVNYTIHQRTSETNAFVFHTKGLARFTEQRPENVIGDAAYGSEEHYRYL